MAASASAGEWACSLDRRNEAPWHNGPVVVVCRADVYARLRELRGDAGLQDVTVP
jgi:hypothetical protein